MVRGLGFCHFFVAENKLAVELDVEEDSSFYIQVKRIINLSVSVETSNYYC